MREFAGSAPTMLRDEAGSANGVTPSTSVPFENPVRFVVFRYAHHSPHSGYSRLAEYGMERFDGEVIRVSKPLSKRLIRSRMLWRLAAGTPAYDRSSMAAELAVAKRMLRETSSIFHFLYGERTYHYSGQLNNHRQNRLIATFHQPPSQLAYDVQIKWHLRQLSAVVCVARNQQEFFADVVEESRIFFVPLGVDDVYYTPPASFDSRDPNLCLIVGSNHRDYPTLRGVIELAAYRRPQTRFVAITSPRNESLTGKHPNLEFRSGIPESELLELYRSAALMVMPLTDATANNAILEGMACGLPIVATDVGGVRDYVNPECSVLIPPQKARKMADAIVDLLGSPKEREKMAEGARVQAEKFSWPKVIDQIQEVYATVA
jgi:glycosyltransferase involved in cell wall biosynthesis